MLDEGFGARIMRLRKEHKLSQLRLAVLLEVSKTTVWKWERGGARPRRANIRALADLFGLSELDLQIGARDEEPECAVCSDPSSIQPRNFQTAIADYKARLAAELGTNPDKIVITVTL